jgi:hypothetical protein
MTARARRALLMPDLTLTRGLAPYRSLRQLTVSTGVLERQQRRFDIGLVASSATRRSERLLAIKVLEARAQARLR